MESGNEYVLQVKGNQSKLLTAIKQTVSRTLVKDVDYTLENNRGRQENRAVYVYTLDTNPIYEQWKGIKHIVHIESYGKRGKRDYLENRYYITSKSIQDAKVYNKGIRSHWGIENGLHWVKDVILNEDKAMVRDFQRSKNMSVVRNIVMNIYRISGNHSIKYAIEAFTNKLDKCLNLLYGKYHILIN